MRRGDSCYTLALLMGVGYLQLTVVQIELHDDGICTESREMTPVFGRLWYLGDVGGVVASSV
jgi:hypothetical protein